MKKWNINITIALISLLQYSAYSQINCITDPPLPPVLTSVSVQPETGKTEITWTLSPSPDIAAYVLYSYKDGDGIPIDTLWDPTATSYTLSSTATKYFSVSYVVAAMRLPRCTSIFSNVLNTIFEQVSIDTCKKKIVVSWNSYPSYPKEVTDYSILMSVNGGNFAEVAKVSPEENSFALNDFTTDAEYFFVVRANLEGGTFSTSNKDTLLTKMQRPPRWINADFATINSDNKVSLSFTVDPLSEITHFSLERKSGYSGNFQEIAQPVSINGSVLFTDNQADVNTINYYRLSAINNCNIPVTASNLSSNIVLSLTRTGNDLNFSWNSYKEWLGIISSCRLFINTGKGFEEKAVIQAADTTITLGYQEIMYEVTGNEVCFFVSVSETSNPYSVTGQSISSGICTVPTEKITVPNVFTPNNDLVNDFFRPVLSFTPVEYHLIISDRQGNILFETKDYHSEWDGSQNGNPQPQGSLFMVFESNYSIGKEYFKNRNAYYYQVPGIKSSDTLHVLIATLTGKSYLCILHRKVLQSYFMGKKDIFDDEDKNHIQAEYDTLVKNLLRCNKPGDRELIDKAFKIANEAHWNMRRKSGEPYIIHPISVAKVVNQEIGLGAKSIAVALLHDVVEDTEYSLEDVKRDFDPKIASLIDGLTKISGTYNKENSSSLQAENFRKMLMTLSDDLRVILIKIADRLHNMRTLDSMPEHKKMKVAGETIFLYAPLANRLGLYAIKSELEDLSFKFRQPQIYEEITSKLKHSEKKYVSLINKFSLPLIEKLTQTGLQFDISGRPKSIFSIWKKMQAKNIPFEEVYDVLAVRIVFEPVTGVPEKTQCWNIYSIITDSYTPKPDRLRDWVSRPKPNGYEALHVTVMGPEGRWVEVQIRSKRMDEIAERGYASHWKYKGDASPETELDKWIKKIRLMLENPLEDPIEFLDEFKMNLFSSEIMVFTPKGFLVSLPKGASALDFAYEIHTEVGNKAIGAKINYKLNPINSILMSGDQVEIITSDIAKPEKEWLSFVRTSKAKEAIKNALKDESKDSIQKGMEILDSKLKAIGLTANNEILKKLLPAFDALNKDELYSGIGLGRINLDNLKKLLKKSPANNVIKYWELKLIGSKKEKKDPEVTQEKIDNSVPFLLRENVDNAEQSYEIAKCCNPIPGDEVTGYHSPEGAIIIHKPKCPVAIRIMSNEGNRIIAVKWAIHKLVSFLARISMTGIDRIGLVNDITNIISSELKVNMTHINVTVQNGIFEGTIDLYVHHTKDLNNLILKISNINGIENIKRVEDFSK